MKKSKATTSTMLLVLIVSVLATAYVPIVTGKPDSSPTHTASISPIVTTLPEEVTYVINVTSTGNSTNFINRTFITLPAGLTYVSHANVSFGGNWFNGTYKSGTHSVNFTTTATTFHSNMSLLFNITLTWPLVPPTEGTFLVDCFKGATASANNTVELTVTFNPKFEAGISPTHVKGSTSFIFNITTTNTGSGIGINKINVTYPTGWTFNALVGYSPATWTVSHDSAKKTFKLTGPNLLIGYSASIRVNMTTPGSSSDPAHWNSTAWDIGGNWLGTYDLSVVVDAVAPTVTINKPSTSVYSVGRGNYIWVNVTVTDDLNITEYGMTVAINDTRFTLMSSEKVTSLQYKYYFANTTRIPDGTLAVKVTATDKAGNVGSGSASTTVDNTPPSLMWIKIRDKDTLTELPYAAGAFWMSKTTAKLQVNASFYDPATVTGTVYFNTSSSSFTNNTWTPAAGFTVGTNDYVILNITIADNASPTANSFTQKWSIYRDEVPPSAPTFTVEAICGGAIITNVAATDNVGILSYKVYVNGSTFVTLTLETWTVDNETRAVAFGDKLVLNLTEVYAGNVANITICAIDYGANEGAGTSATIDIPEGLWYPITLAKGWNLISLPLVPSNSSVEAVLSGVLDDLDVVWSYDTETETWFSYSPGAPSTLTQMVDGKGYWVKMNAATTLIVDGTELPPPPELPPAYKVVPGWNLIGFKETTTMTASDYLAGVTWVRMYAFYNGRYYIVLPAHDMVPGRGYWIAVTEEGWIYP
jgi:hypothetical protein